jgi:hypothetical protein
MSPNLAWHNGFRVCKDAHHLLILKAMTTNSQSTTPRIMSVRAIAAAVKMDRAHLMEFVEEANVPVYQAGPKTIRIDLDELLAAMREYRKETTAQAL